MGIGHSEKKGRERAGEINRIRRIQLAQRRSEFKKKKKKGREGNGVQTSQPNTECQRKETPEKREIEQEKQRNGGWDRPRQWSWVALEDKKKQKNGGRVLEVSLCHCTACQPLAGSLPFRWFITPELFSFNRVVNGRKRGELPACQTVPTLLITKQMCPVWNEHLTLNLG